MIMINNKKISKIFRVMSLFLVIIMVVGLLHSERTFAKKKGYDIFKTLDNGYSIVMKLHEHTDPSYGMADKKGKIVLPMKYYEINNESDGLLGVRAEKEYTFGYVDKKGKIVIPVVYEAGYDFNEGLAPVSKDGKWGFINKIGDLVVPFQYDDAFSFNEGLANVKKSGK